VVSGKCDHRIRTNRERLQRLDLVDLKLEKLLRFRRQELVIRKVSLKRLCGPFPGLPRRLEIQNGSSNHAVVWAAREKMRRVQMISMGMGLQAIVHVAQRTTVHL
jgi:hypothetical protein